MRSTEERSTIESLYATFTTEEMDRLNEIKSHPEWIPRSKISGLKAKPDGAQFSFWLSKSLRAKLRAKCKELNITMRDYVIALLEAALS